MSSYLKCGYCLLFAIVCLSVYAITVEAEVKSVSACHSAGDATCNFITLECSSGSRIRLLTMKYGVKSADCNASKNRCFRSNKNGCCVQSDADCTEYYSDLHAYNLHRECSGKQSCGPLPVPNNVLRSCDGRSSTYVHVTYECQIVSDDDSVRLCREENYDNLNGGVISVFFNKSVDVFTTPTNCSCFLASDGTINIDYVDVRLTKAHTSGPGSDCSTAVLTTTPDDNTDTTCDSAQNEDENFIYGALAETGLSYIEVKLLNLYVGGNNDAPEFIWLNINAKNQVPVNVQCFKHLDQPQTTSKPSITTSEKGSSLPANTTDDGLTEGDGSNTGAIVAGILVPLVLLAVIGAFIAFIVVKRRGFLRRKEQPHAAPNRYSENAVVDNSVENSEYAEIGYVPDVPETEPPYDPVYEPKKKRSDASNGHAYQNVGSANKGVETPTKNPKWPLGIIKSHKDRLISFFRNQHEKDFPQVTKRDKDVSDGSYDHLRPQSANSEVHVEVTPASDEPAHTYSHTTDESVKRQVAANRARAVNNPGEDINAVHVGDSYIEFQFGAMDKDHPDLVKADDREITRPVPPSRPPPSPRSAARFDTTPSPRASPKQSHNKLFEEKNVRSKSPNFLTPDDKSHEKSNPNYDYGSEGHAPTLSGSPHPSEASDVSSEHSYKILEEQPVYDYAEVSDCENTDGMYQPGSIYEDVDKDSRRTKSAADVTQDSNEYLEPITSKTRAISDVIKTDLKDKRNNPETLGSKDSQLRKELIEKTRLKGRSDVSQTPGNRKNDNVTKTSESNKQNHNRENKAIKSDNVNTKDYQTADNVKGVLKMAKMFETKDSDSDSSRQNSPRHINVTKNPKKQNVDRTTSDA